MTAILKGVLKLGRGAFTLGKWVSNKVVNAFKDEAEAVVDAATHAAAHQSLKLVERKLTEMAEQKAEAEQKRKEKAVALGENKKKTLFDYLRELYRRRA